MKLEYITAKHPKTKRWHVLGFAGTAKSGRNQYIPVSDGFKTELEALRYIPKLKMAVASAKAELAL